MKLPSDDDRKNPPAHHVYIIIFLVVILILVAGIVAKLVHQANQAVTSSDGNSLPAMIDRSVVKLHDVTSSTVPIGIRNRGDEELEISVSWDEHLNSGIKSSSTNAIIGPNSRQEITFDFDTHAYPHGDVTVGSLVFTGNTGTSSIPLIIEKPTNRNVDVVASLPPSASQIAPGMPTTVNLILNNYDLGSVMSTLKTKLVDIHGNVVLERSGRISIDKRTESSITITPPHNLATGTYVLKFVLETRDGVATNSLLIHLVKSTANANFVQVCSSDLFCKTSVMAIIAIILGLVLFAYSSKIVHHEHGSRRKVDRDHEPIAHDHMSTLENFLEHKKRINTIREHTLQVEHPERNLNDAVEIDQKKIALISQIVKLLDTSRDHLDYTRVDEALSSFKSAMRLYAKHAEGLLHSDKDVLKRLEEMAEFIDKRTHALELEQQKNDAVNASNSIHHNIAHARHHISKNDVDKAKQHHAEAMELYNSFIAPHSHDESLFEIMHDVHRNIAHKQTELHERNEQINRLESKSQIRDKIRRSRDHLLDHNIDQAKDLHQDAFDLYQKHTEKFSQDEHLMDDIDHLYSDLCARQGIFSDPLEAQSDGALDKNSKESILADINRELYKTSKIKVEKSNVDALTHRVVHYTKVFGNDDELNQAISRIHELYKEQQIREPPTNEPMKEEVKDDNPTEHAKKVVEQQGLTNRLAFKNSILEEIAQLETLLQSGAEVNNIKEKYRAIQDNYARFEDEFYAELDIQTQLNTVKALIEEKLTPQTNTDELAVHRLVSELITNAQAFLLEGKIEDAEKSYVEARGHTQSLNADVAGVKDLLTDLDELRNMIDLEKHIKLHESKAAWKDELYDEHLPFIEKEAREAATQEAAEQIMQGEIAYHKNDLNKARENADNARKVLKEMSEQEPATQQLEDSVERLEENIEQAENSPATQIPSKSAAQSNDYPDIEQVSRKLIRDDIARVKEKVQQGNLDAAKVLYKSLCSRYEQHIKNHQDDIELFNEVKVVRQDLVNSIHNRLVPEDPKPVPEQNTQSQAEQPVAPDDGKPKSIDPIKQKLTAQIHYDVTRGNQKFHDKKFRHARMLYDRANNNYGTYQDRYGPDDELHNAIEALYLLILEHKHEKEHMSQEEAKIKRRAQISKNARKAEQLASNDRIDQALDVYRKCYREYEAYVASFGDDIDLYTTVDHARKLLESAKHDMEEHTRVAHEESVAENLEKAHLYARRGHSHQARILLDRSKKNYNKYAEKYGLHQDHFTRIQEVDAMIAESKLQKSSGDQNIAKPLSDDDAPKSREQSIRSIESLISAAENAHKSGNKDDAKGYYLRALKRYNIHMKTYETDDYLYGELHSLFERLEQ